MVKERIIIVGKFYLPLFNLKLPLKPLQKYNNILETPLNTPQLLWSRILTKVSEEVCDVLSDDFILNPCLILSNTCESFFLHLHPPLQAFMVIST